MFVEISCEAFPGPLGCSLRPLGNRLDASWCYFLGLLGSLLRPLGGLLGSLGGLLGPPGKLFGRESRIVWFCLCVAETFGSLS